MNRSPFHFRLLMAFRLLFELNSVTRASEQMHMTQAAMSNSLAQLRSLFDDPLFVRQSKGIAPTPKAIQLYPKIINVLNAVEHLFIDVAFDPATSDRQFVLALSDHGEHIVLPQLMRRLENEAPHIRLQIRRFPSAPQQILFEESAIDYAIGLNLSNQNQLERIILFQEGAVCVMRAQHPNKDKRLTLKKYLAAKHVAISYDGNQQATFIDNQLAQLTKHRRRTVVVPHITTALAMIENTDMIGTFPRRLTEALASRYAVVLKKPPFRIAHCPLDLTWSQKMTNDPVHCWLRENICRIFALNL